MELGLPSSQTQARTTYGDFPHVFRGRDMVRKNKSTGTVYMSSQLQMKPQKYTKQLNMGSSSAAQASQVNFRNMSDNKKMAT